ncbi:MAG: hypothetical protein FWG65_13235 [Turicibacter sp.]|nr:hypothetical protein [Turicibacter sp.]
MTVVEIEKRIFQPNKYGTIKENLQNNASDMLEMDTVAKSKRIFEVEDAILRVQTARVQNEKIYTKCNMNRRKKPKICRILRLF